ncbi:MAG: hypothetical protein K1X74_11035 [Pirellulales bacterium]|nr:hypothetical protein [Pirellulales bacterium]
MWRNTMGDCLHVEIVKVAKLSQDIRLQMYRLMNSYFCGVSKDIFLRDLGDKEWALILCTADRRVRGFVTIRSFYANLGNQPVHVLYTGDAVIAPEHWGHHGWLRLWARHMFGLALCSQAIPTYWIMLTASPRLYRMLPGFFCEYYPRESLDIPNDIRGLRDDVVNSRFPGQFNSPVNLVIPFTPTPVREPELARIEAGRDEHDSFFVRANPGYLDGEFLVCITAISSGNLTALGNRLVGADERLPVSPG